MLRKNNHAPSPPLPPIPQRTASPDLPPTPSRPGPGDIDDDDLPPPYTPSANVGEETVSLGPRRPFQQPPPLPPPSLRIPDQPSNWPPPSVQPDQGLAPWQTQQQYRQRQRPDGGLFGALVDTVRDIADVISGAHDDRLMASRTANAGAYASSGTRSVYAPPSGPPGQVFQPPPPRAASTPPRSPPSIADDGSPTRTPVPGHPLLRDGNLLVYPRDYLCVKCKNTGYKNYDPSHPCRKCWEKHGRPYTGALTYMPWSTSGNDPRMQRPLPRFLPPHLAGLSPGPSSCSSQSPCRSYPPPPQHPSHNRSVSQPPYAPSPGSGPSYYVLNPLSPCDVPPVPDAILVGPGDPRLGGRLCWRCGGGGIRTVMLIDVTTCDTCGGTGRVWT